jgi:hypothetical protein
MKAVFLLVLILGLGGGALVGAFYGYRAAFGSPVDGKCEDVLGCEPGAICIGRRCYQSCDDDADCRSGWHCGTTRVEITERGGYSLEDRKSEGTKKICFPPKATKP